MCLPSMAPIQFGNCLLLSNFSATVSHSSGEEGTFKYMLYMFLMFFMIASQTSFIMYEMALVEILNWQLRYLYVSPVVKICCQGRSFFRINNFIPTKDLFTGNILFDVALYLLKIGMIHSHHIFIFCHVFNCQFLHDVVEIAPFIPSSDPLTSLSLPAFSILIIQNFESDKNCQ